MHDQERKALKVNFLSLCRANRKYLRRTVFKPYVEMFCLRAIRFYQKYLSQGKGVCRYTPTCSQYTLESIHNNGVVIGILLGAWRIMRCNPLSKGGYNPAPFPYRKKKWLL